ncbi:Peroxisomal membrane signal receptor PTS1, partial [Serendipita sp. 399]
MSFPSLISGADCSTSSNPLSQVLKHTDLQHLPRTQLPLVNQADIASARQFFQQHGPSPVPGINLGTPISMGLPTPPAISSGSATPLLGFEKWKEQQMKESFSGDMGDMDSIQRQNQPVLHQQPEL